MSYVINKTNGIQLSEIIDGSIDQLSTNLTLVGRDYNNYGEFINENFVFLLENFANTSAPDKPLTGQLWFDTTSNKLRVYNGQSFQHIGEETNFGFSMDITGLSASDIAATLNIIFPPNNYQEGATCRIHCIDNSVRSNQISTITNGVWSNPTVIP